MATEIGSDPVDALIQDLLYYHEPSRVMICTLCQCIVLDNTISRHLRVNKAHQDHPVILTPAAVLHHFQKFPARVQTCEDLQIPSEEILAIPHLPIDRQSLQCQIGECNWIGRMAQRMQEHIRDKHHSTHFNPPGPTLPNPQGAWISVCSQQFTIRGPGAQRFAVLAPSDDSAASPAEPPASLPGSNPTLLDPTLAPQMSSTRVDTSPLARARRRIDQRSSQSASKTLRQRVPRVVIPGPALVPTDILPVSPDPRSSPLPSPPALRLVALNPVVIDPVAPRRSIPAVRVVHVLLEPVVTEPVAAVPRLPMITLAPIELPMYPPAPPVPKLSPLTTASASLSVTQMTHAISIPETPIPSQPSTSPTVTTDRTFRPSTTSQFLHAAVHAWAAGCPLCRVLGKSVSERSHPLFSCTQSRARGIRKKYTRIAAFLTYNPPRREPYCPHCLLPYTICGGGVNPNLPSACQFARVVLNTVNTIIITDDDLVNQYVIPWMRADGLDPELDDRDIAYRWLASEKEIDGLYLPVVTHLFYQFYKATIAQRPASRPTKVPPPAEVPQSTSRVTTPTMSSPNMRSSGRLKRRRVDENFTYY